MDVGAEPFAPDGLWGLGADALPDGLVIADATGAVCCFNAAAVRITGIRAEDALGKHLADALPLEDIEGRRWWVCTDPYGGLGIRTRQPERNLVLNGREVLVTASYVRRSGANSPVTHVAVSLRCTAARRRDERNHAELIATVAHELRSPLTSVKGFTATLLRKWERFTDEQKRLMLETVDADADRVTRLITELLDISRIDSGRLQLHREIVDLADAVDRHVRAQTAAGQPADRFRVLVEQPLPPIWMDRDKLDQILGNLLENAVRHGAGAVTIKVSRARLTPPGPRRDDGAAPGRGPSDGATGGPDDGRADGDEATEITVSDEGPGIPDELLNRVFTRFWRGNRRRGGTGLGLYIVKGLVEAHGGTIDAGRAEGGGAMFRFRLPAGMPDALT
ncbi:ATP-binding protein [Yinghuangia sp. ASG 101]|uniref:sensor histidine kinase n=1 Tax=Yinghuangia sp. ASG 101 TaxID=2896848 RepID=UPI001E354DEA|nr:ATP-binding protein [Yinghuangia sp. ASG 101]UGQ10715.1 ATP-binding protein [Yinghuangia sp. ASG 101]